MAVTILTTDDLQIVEGTDVKTKKRADALLKRLEDSKSGRWHDLIVTSLRESENDILARASERLEAKKALSPAEAAAIVRELMHK